MTRGNLGIHLNIYRRISETKQRKEINIANWAIPPDPSLFIQQIARQLRARRKSEPFEQPEITIVRRMRGGCDTSLAC